MHCTMLAFIVLTEQPGKPYHLNVCAYDIPVQPGKYCMQRVATACLPDPCCNAK